MIHFDFIVDDIDAENIIRAIGDDALRNNEYKMHYLSRSDLTDEQKDSYCRALDANKEYMIGLIGKMNYTSIE